MRLASALGGHAAERHRGSRLFGGDFYNISQVPRTMQDVFSWFFDVFFLCFAKWISSDDAGRKVAASTPPNWQVYPNGGGIPIEGTSMASVPQW